jgi:hypothetical protein
VAFHSRLAKASPTRFCFADHPSSGCRHWPESQGFHIEFSDLDLTEEHLIEVFRYQFEAKILKAKYLANENPVLVPAHVAAVVDPPRQEALSRGASRMASSAAPNFQRCEAPVYCLVAKVY